MRRFNVLAALALGLCGSFLMPMAAHAAKTRNVAAFAIPPQPLSSALIVFSRQAHVQILTSPNAKLGATRSPGVSGNLTAPQALSKLLRGTGFVSEFTDPGTAVIKAAAPQHSSSSMSPAEERSSVLTTLRGVEVVGRVQALSATRADTPIKDIPQSVSVISRQFMDEQNAMDLSSALKYATGISTVNLNSRQVEIRARGFTVSTAHIDGSAPFDILAGSNGATSNNINMAGYSNVQVLRGSDALFGGMGNPGASLNLQRKMPTSTLQSTVTMRAGSWDQYNAVGDISGPLSSSWQGRIVVAGSKQHYYYDVARDKRRYVYGVLKYVMSPTAYLAMGGSYGSDTGVNNYSGLPFGNNGEDLHLPRSAAIVAPWAKAKSRNTQAFVELHTELGEHWSLQANATYASNRSPGSVLTTYLGPVDMQTHLLARPLSASVARSSTNQVLFDAILTGSFEWWGHAQRVMFGIDYAHNRRRGTAASLAYESALIDPFRFNPYALPAPDLDEREYTTTIDSTSIQTGIYGSVRLTPVDGLNIIIGGRRSGYRSSDRATITVGDLSLPPASSGFKNKGKFTPYAGITYDLSRHFTAYASYADIYSVNGGVITQAGESIPPSNGNTVEVGIKGAWFDNSLNASFAVFNTKQRGVALFDASVPPPRPPRCCYVRGTNISKGFELDVSGAITPNWQISAGFTHDKANLFGSNISQTGPVNLLKIWTNYMFPGGLWEVGGGINAQSLLSITECPESKTAGVECSGRRIHQGAHLIANARVARSLGSRWKVALNVNNITNRRYWQTLAAVYSGNFYGAPRNVMLKAVYTF